MHSGMARLVTVVCASVVIVGCEAGRPVAPADADADVTRAAADKAPSGLSAGAASTTQINLAWQDNSPNETGFEVHRSTTGPTGTFTLLASTAANVTSYSNQGLTPGTQYCYEVRLFRRTGGKTTYSAFTEVACATTPAPPAPASNASAVPKDGNTVALSWTDNSSTEEGFRVQRAASDAGPWETITTTAPNVASYTDPWRQTEQQVCYRVVAFNYSGGEAAPSNTDCTAPPATPWGLVAKSADPQSVDLTWPDNSAVEDGYEVQRSTDGVSFGTVANLPAGSTSYHDGGLAAELRYTYFVRAKKDGGFSYPSNYASAVPTNLPPSAPTLANATPSYSSGVWVTWVDNSQTEDGFRVQRGPTSAGPWETVGTTGADYPYFSEGGLTPEQQVCYQVIAFNSKGESAPSNVDCTAPPLPPTNVVATTVDDQSIDLTWTPAGPDVKDGYRVRDGFRVLRIDYYSYYCDEWGNCWYDYVPIADLPADATSYRDAGLWSGTWYSYYVVALNDGGTSDWSNEATAVTDQPPGTNATASASIASARQRPSASALRAAVARAKAKMLSAQTAARGAAQARAAASAAKAAKASKASKASKAAKTAVRRSSVKPPTSK
jgi:hypothetical protein